jgi:glutamate carboxypeptidase
LVEVLVDVRFSDPSAAYGVGNALAALKFKNPDISMSIERTSEVAYVPMNFDSYIFKIARESGGDLGIDLTGIEAQGASDMNNVGAVNVNVIEALGACGAGAHSAEHEYVNIDSLPRRASLTASIAERVLADCEANQYNTEEIVNG